MKIELKGKTIELKNSFRSHIIYENLTGETFQPKSVTNFITFFYCSILGSDVGNDLKFDDFIDWLDEKPELLTEFTQWLMDINKIQEDISPEKPKKSKKKSVKNPN